MDPHVCKVVIALSEEDGGGYLATVPELRDCMPDGETLQVALRLPARERRPRRRLH